VSDTATGTVTLTATTGTIAFSGGLTTDALSTAAAGYNVAITGASNTITNAVTFSNTGTLTLGDGSGDSLAFTGGVTATAPSSRSIAGTISAAGTGVINFGTVSVTADATVGGASTGQITLGNATLADGATLTVGAGAATPISLAAVSGTASGAASNLTVNTTGTVTVSGNIGTDLGVLTVTNSGGITFTGTVSVATLTITDTTDAQTVLFSNDVTVTTGMSAAANGGYLVNLVGTTTTVAGSTTFGNTGGVRFGDNSTGDILTFSGGVNTTASTLALQSRVRTAGAAATFGAVVTQGTAPGIDTTNNGGTATGGDITLGAVTNTGGGTTFSLNAGNGAGSDISGTSVAGQDTLTITQADSVSFSGSVATGTSIVLTDTNLSITFSGAVTTPTLTTAAQSYSLALNGGGTITNAVAFTNTGAVQLGDAAGDSLTLNGGATVTAPSGLTLGGTIASSDDALVLGDGNTAITLAANTTVDTNAATTAGDITLGAVTGAGFNLTLETAGGVAGADVTGSSVSGVGALTFQNIGNASAATVSFTGAVSATSLVAGNTVNIVSLTGTGGTITNAVAFDNNGTLTLGQAAGTQTYTGGLDTTGTNGTVTLNGTIQTTDTALTLGAATLGSAVTLAAGAGTVTNTGITGGANALTISADEINNNGAANSITGTGAIVFQPGSASTNVNVAGADSGQATTLDLLTTDLDDIANGHSSITIGRTDGTGLVTVSAVTFNDPITIRNGGATGDITIAGALATALATAAGGSVTTDPITINAGRNLTLNSTVTTGAASITGATNGPVDTATSGNLTVTVGGSITGAGSLNTGNASVDNGDNDGDDATSGFISITASGAIQLSGSDALNSGDATVGTPGASDNGVSGNITIVSATRLASNGTTGLLDVSMGTASGNPTTGAFSVTTTTGGAGDAGAVYITTGEAIRFGAISTGAGNIRLQGNTMDFAGAANSVAGSGTLVIEPAAAATTVGIGSGTGTLSLTSTEIGTFANGFSSITIGRSDSSAALTTGGSVTFVDNVTLLGGSIASAGTVTGTGASVTFNAVAGDITDSGNDTTSNIAASTIVLIATGSIGVNTSDNTRFDVSAVSSLSITAGANFAVRSADAGALTTLNLTVTPATVNNTYALLNFTSLTLGLTDGTLATTCANLAECVVLSGTSWSGSNALSLSVTATAGDIRINDLGVSMSSTVGNTLVLTASNGDIFDHNTSTSDDPNPPNAAQFNIVTSNPNTNDSVTLSAVGNSVGTGTPGDATNGDIDVSGASNFSVVATTSSTFNNTAGVTTLEGTPLVNGLEDINLNASGGGVTYTVNENCQDGASCITVSITNTNSLAYTGHTGDIYIVSGGITLTGGGDVTLTAEAGGIFEATNNTTTDISTTGAITLNASTSIGTQHLTSETAGTTVVADAPVDLAGTTLTATASAGNLLLNELNAIALQAIAASGTFSITAGGNITDDANDSTRITAAAVILSSTGALGASGATNELDTTTASLTLIAGTDFFVANNSDLADLTITSTQAGDVNTYSLSATNLTFTLADGGTSYTMTNVSDTTGLNFSFTGDQDIAVSVVDVTAANTVGLTTAGAISDGNAGANNVIASTLTVSGASVDLDTTIATLNATSAGTVAIDETDGLTLGDITANSLVVTAAGAIADDVTADIAVTGLADLTATGNTLTIGNGNTFAAGSLDLAGTTVSVTEDNASVLADVDATDLTLVSGGAISQSGALTVINSASFTTGGFTINLSANGAGNDFGSVQLVNTGANNVDITDGTGLDLGTSSIGGDLIAVAGTGNITDSGTVSVGGDASFTTNTGGDDIDLGTLNVTGSIALSTAGGGDATVVNAGTIDFATSNVTGALVATSTGGSITESGDLTVVGTASFTATTALADIDLDTPGGDFGSTVTLTNDSGNVSMADPNTLTLGPSTLGTGTASFTSADIAIAGLVDSGGAVTINATGSAGLGDATEFTAALELDNAELANISATSFTLTSAGDLFIASTTAVSTATLGDVTLTSDGTTYVVGAGADGIDFDGDATIDLFAAIFAGGLTILSDQGIVVDALDAVPGSDPTILFGIWAQGGNLVLDGDADADGVDPNDGINVTDGGNASGATQFQLVFLAIAEALDDSTTQTLSVDAGTQGVSSTMAGGTEGSVIFVADDGVTLASGSPINFQGRVQFIGDCGNCPTAETDGFFVNDGVGTVTINSTITTTDTGGSTNDDISIFGADVVITAALNADDSIQFDASSGNAVNIGTATGGFELSNAELDLLTAGDGVRVSTFDTNVTMTGVTSAVSDGFGGGIELRGGDSVFVGANDLFGGLLVQATNDAVFSGALTLGTNGTFDVQTETGDINFASGASVTGAFSVFLNAGTTPASGGQITSAAGTFTLEAEEGIFFSADGGVALAGGMTLDADTDDDGGDFSTNAAITAGGDVSIRTFDINLGNTIDAGANRVTIVASNNGTIDLGANGGGQLTLDSAEINNIIAGVLQIGSLTNGNITLNADIAPTGTNTLHLISGGNVWDDTNDGVAFPNTGLTPAFGITVQNLAIEAGGGVMFGDVGATLANDVDVLAIHAGLVDPSAGLTGPIASLGTVAFRDLDGVTIGTVDGVSGLTTADNPNGPAGTIGLRVGGDIIINAAVTAGNSTVTHTELLALDAILPGFFCDGANNCFVSAASVSLVVVDAAASGSLTGAGNITGGSVTLDTEGATGGSDDAVGGLTFFSSQAADILLTGTITSGNATVIGDGDDFAQGGLVRVRSYDPIVGFPGATAGSAGTALNPLDIVLGSGVGDTGSTDGAFGFEMLGSAFINLSTATPGGTAIINRLRSSVGADTIQISTSGTDNLRLAPGAQTANLSTDTLSLHTGTGDITIVIPSLDVGSFDIATGDNGAGDTGSINVTATTGTITGAGSITTGDASGTSGTITVLANGNVSGMALTTGTGNTTGDINVTSTAGFVNVEVNTSPGSVASGRANVTSNGNIFLSTLFGALIGDLDSGPGGDAINIGAGGLADLTFASGSTYTDLALDNFSAGTGGGTLTFGSDLTASFIGIATNGTGPGEGDIVINATLSTPDVTAQIFGTGTGSINITTSGSGGSITGTGTLRTGDFTFLTDGCCADTLRSGGILVTAAEEIEGLTFATGDVNWTNPSSFANAGPDTLQPGDITLQGSHIGTSVTPVTVEFGATTFSNPQSTVIIQSHGVLTLATADATGAADIFVRTNGSLYLGNVQTGALADTLVFSTVSSDDDFVLTAQLADASLDGDSLSFVATGDVVPTNNSSFTNDSDGVIGAPTSYQNINLGATGTLSITADSIDLGGTVTAGGGVAVTPADNGSTIGLGNSDGIVEGQNFFLSNSTLQTLVRAGGGTVTVGQANSGNIFINFVDFRAASLGTVSGGNLVLVTGGSVTDTGSFQIAFASDNGGGITITSGQSGPGTGTIDGFSEPNTPISPTDQFALLSDYVTVTGTGGSDVDIYNYRCCSGSTNDAVYNIVTGGAGNIVIYNDAAIGGLTTGVLVGSIVTTGTVTITAANGAINDDVVDAITDIAGSSITLTATSGIGSGVAPLGLASASIQATTANGNIDVFNTSATDDFVNAQLTTGVGYINFFQTGDAFLTVNAQTSDGSIAVTSDAGPVSIGLGVPYYIYASSIVAGGSGDVSLTTTGGASIFVGQVTATGNTITIDSSGDIDTDGSNDGAASPDLVANAIDLTAGGTIGASSFIGFPDLYLSASSIDAAGVGNVTLFSTLGAPVTVNSLLAINGGNIVFNQFGGGTVTFTSVTTLADGTPAPGESDITLTNKGSDLITTTVTAGGEGNVVVQTVSSGNITAGDITATDNNITLNSQGQVVVAGTTDSGTGRITIDATGAILNGGGLLAGSELVLHGFTIGSGCANGSNPGNCIQTQVSSLQATKDSATSGGIEIINNGDLVLADLSGLGYAISNTIGGFNVINTGSVTINSGVTGAGHIGITANGATSDITQNAASPISGAFVDFIAGRNVALNSVSAPGSSITVTASTGAITDNSAGEAPLLVSNFVLLHAATGIGDGNAIETTAGFLNVDNSTSGNVAIVETDGVTLSSLFRNQAAAGTLSLTALDGTINTSTATVTSNGGDITFTAIDATGAGNATPAGIIVGTGGMSSGGGVITLDAADDVTLSGSNVQAGAGNIVVIADDDALDTSGADTDGAFTGNQLNGINISINAAEGISGVLLASTLTVDNRISGNVTLIQNGSDVSLLTTFRNQAPGGTLSLVNGNGSIDTAGVAVSSNNGVITFNAGDATAGSPVTLTVGAGGVSSGGNTINLLSADHVVVTGAVNAGAGAVNVAADNAASEGAPGAADTTGSINGGGLITAGTANLDASEGIGDTTQLQLAASFLSADTATGDIDLNSTGAGLLTVTSLTTTASNIDVTAAGSVYLADNAVVAPSVTTTGTGTVTFDVNGASSDFLADDGISTASGQVTITADRSVVLGGNGDINSTSGNIVITADADEPGTVGTGTFTQGAASSISTGSGTIAITADGDMLLGTLATSNATAAAVTLTSDEGGIVDNSDVAQNVAANFGRLVIRAATGVGSANAIETVVGQIDLDNSTSGNVAITETDGIQLENFFRNQNASGNLSLTAGGAITDGTAATIETGALATFNAGANAITIGDDDTVNFGSVSLTGGVVTLTEDSGMVLAGLSVTTATLSAAGDITDAAATTLNASGLVTLDANGGANDITLGNDDNVTFGSINFTGNAVTFTEDDATVLSGLNTANTLVLASNGTLTDGIDGDLAIAGNASLSATGMTLGNDAGNDTNFGTLTFASAAGGQLVSISEDSDTDLAGASSSAGGLNLVSAGHIDDGAGINTDISITGGNATLTAATTIDLGGEAGEDTNFLTVTFTGTTVSIDEDSGTDLTGLNSATGGLTLVSAGALSDGAGIGTDLTVTGGNADLVGTSISLGGQANEDTNFATLTFTSGGAVSIQEDSQTDLTGTLTASSLALNSTTAIVDAAGTSLSVANNASFTAPSTVLGDSLGDSTNFGSLTLNGGSATVTEDSAMTLAGMALSGSATLLANGAIDDGTNATLNVAGLVTLDSSGNSIAIGNEAGDTVTFGSVDLTGSTVSFTEDDGTVLAGLDATTATIIAGGAISDSTGTVNVVGAATFSASGFDIDLGSANTLTLGSVTLVGNAITVSEDDGAVLTTVTASSFVDYTANGNIDVGTINSSGGIALDATGDIVDAGSALSGTNLVMTATGAIGASGGELNTAVDNITANSGNGVYLIEADGAVLVSISVGNDAEANDVEITSTNGNLAVGTIVTGGVASDVTLTTLNAGASVNNANIVDDAVDFILDITAQDITLSGATGVGDEPGLELEVSGENYSFDGGTGGVGIVDLAGGDITLAISTAGNIFYGTGGNILVDFVISSTGGDITLLSNNGYIADAFDDTTQDISGGTVTLTAELGIGGNGLVGGGSTATDSFGTVGALEVTSSTLNAHTDGASAPIVIRDDDGTITGDIDTVNGDIYILSEGGDLEVGDIVAGAGAFDVTIQALTGAITDSFDSSGTPITGDTVTLLSDTGVGLLFDRVETTATTLVGDAATSGGVFITETNGATLQSITAPNGAIVVTSGFGNLTIDLVNSGFFTVLAAPNGTLTDGATGDITVGGQALLVANSITLGNDAGNDTNFGSLTFDAGGVGAVTLSEDSDTDLTGDSLAGTLTLTSAGNISDAGATSIDVAGLADFTATGDISLGIGGTFSAGTLTFDGAAVTIFEDGNTDLVGTVTADSLDLNSDGNISDLGATSIAVTNLADVFATGSVNLGSGGTFDAGTLTFNGVDVFISEDSNTDLVGISSASFSLDLDSTGAISDAGATSVDVAGLADINAGTTIDLGNGGTFNAGTLTFDGTDVAVAEDSDMDLVGVNSATGDLTLSSTGSIFDFGATSVTVGGLTDATAVANISLGGGTFNTGTLTFNGFSVLIVEDSGIDLVGASTANDLTLTATGAIDDAGATSLDVATLAQFSATSSITLGSGGTFNAGNLNFNGTAVTISEDSDTDLVGVNTATSLNLASAGAITDVLATSIDVSGLADVSAATTIDLGAGGTFNAGTLTFDGTDVAISEDSNTDLVGVNSATGALTLDSTGAISDAGATSVAVGGLADVDAATSITLGSGGTFDAGTLTFDGTTVVISEDSNTDLVGISSASSLNLDSTGAISDAGATSVTITGLADVDAATSITLGSGGTFDAGTLTFDGTNVTIAEDSNTDLAGVNVATGALTLDSTGAISDAGATSVTVGGLADVDAATSITLGSGGTFNAGTLTFDGSNVTIAEDSDTDLVGASSATGFLTLNSTGAISDAGATSVTIGGLADVDAATTIDLGGGIFNAGTLTFDGTIVTIAEDSNTDLVGVNSANSLNLDSTGTISDAGAVSVTISGLANVDAVTTISLGGGIFNAGTLTFDGTDVTIAEDSNTDLVGVSLATGTLTLDSTGSISDAGATSVTVGGLADVDATTTINLGGGIFNAGTLTFDGTNVTIAEDSGTDLVGASSASGFLTLDSTGAISDAGATSVTIGGLADVDAGTSIDLGNGGTFNAGTLTFDGTVVTISEDSNTDLVGANAATTSLTLDSVGAISDAGATSVTVGGLADVDAATTISLGGGIFNAGTLTFDGTTVTISEDSDTDLVGVSTASANLTLDSTGAISDAGATSVTVGGLADVDAATTVSLGGGIFNAGTLTFDGTGVTISEDSDTNLVGVNSATGSLTLDSTGAISDAGATSVTVGGLADVDAATTISLGGGTFNAGTLTFDAVNVTIAEDSNTDLVGVNVATGTLALDSTGAISDAGATSVTVGGLADVDATTTISLGGGIFNAGTLTFDGTNVTIAEDSDTALVGVNAATGTLTLDSTGSISDAGATSVTVGGLADVDATTTLNLGSGTFNAGTLRFDGTDVTIAEDSDTALVGVNAATGTLILDSTGAISDAGATSVTVGSLADVGAGTNITLGLGGTFNAGTLTFTGAVVTIAEDSDTNLAGISSATSLNLDSTGLITDAGATSVTISGLADVDAATSISLGGGTFNAGTLRFDGTNVTIAEDSNTDLVGVNAATGTLTLDSTGAISDAGATSVTVGGLAHFGATASVNLGGGIFNAGTLNFVGTTVTVAEDSSTDLFGANVATAGLTLSSTAGISDGAGLGTDLSVGGTASLTGTTISLGGETGEDTNFTALRFTGTTVSIDEDSAIQLIGASSATGNLALTAAGTITQDTSVGSMVTVSGTTTLNANVGGSPQDITLFNGTNNFNTVAITIGNVVQLADANTLVLGNASVAQLTVNVVTGNLTDAGNLTIGTAQFTAGGNITLGDLAGENVSFSSLNFNAGGNVNIAQDAGTMTLAGANGVGGTLTLSSAGGDITDGSSATLNVAGLTTLSANGNDVTLNNAGHVLGSVSASNVGTLTLATGASDLDGIDLGNITAGTLSVTTAAGDIDTTSTGGVLTIAGASTFTTSNADIILNNNNAFGGTVSFTGATNVTVRDTTQLDLFASNIPGSLNVTADGITTSGLITVGQTATFDALGNVLDLTNGGAGNNFNILVVSNAGDLFVEDTGAIELGNIGINGDFTLDAAGAVTTSGAQNIAGTTTIVTSVGSVTVNGNFVGAVDISSAADVTVTDTAGGLVIATIDGDNVTLTAGSIADATLGDGTPAVPGEDDIIVGAGGTLVITTTGSIGASGESIEINSPANGVVTINAGAAYLDFANDVTTGTLNANDGLTIQGAGVIELLARTITVTGNFGSTSTNTVLTARNRIIGDGGTISANILQLDALNLVAFGGDNDDGSPIIGALDAPILLDMSNGANYQVPGTPPGSVTLNGFGFISASNFTGSDFQDIFSASHNKIFLIANFTDLIASVQGSFITAQIFTIDSSQFRADLNIFGVDGAGVLLPHDQCEDEESADCAKQ
jgi:hypothetical protein